MGGLTLILIGILLLLASRAYGSTLAGRKIDSIEVVALVALTFGGFLIILISFVLFVFGL